MLKLRKNKKGFTLVELIVVIAIMAVLAGTVAGVTVSQLNKSKNDTAASEIKNLLNDFETYLANYDVSKITTEATAEAAVDAFNTEKKTAKGITANILTKNATGVTVPKAGKGEYVYTVTYEAAGGSGATATPAKIKLKIWCDKVGSTGAKPEAERTYEI